MDITHITIGDIDIIVQKDGEGKAEIALFAKDYEKLTMYARSSKWRTPIDVPISGIVKRYDKKRDNFAKKLEEEEND